MDPNATLKETLEIAKRLIAWADGDEHNDDFLILEDSGSLRMAELVIALDGWIRQGGFLPADWSKA